MKRNVLLALLCLGVCSVLAIAASIPGHVRVLSDAEKAIISAGDDCHHCERCADPTDCFSNSYCSGKAGGTACGGDFSWMAQKCTNGSGPLSGPCWTSQDNTCLLGYYCFCWFPDGDPECTTMGEWHFIRWDFSNGPC